MRLATSMTSGIRRYMSGRGHHIFQSSQPGDGDAPLHSLAEYGTVNTIPQSILKEPSRLESSILPDAPTVRPARGWAGHLLRCW